MREKKIVVKQGEPEVAVEVLAQSIVNISQGIRRLTQGPLNDKALLLLIQHASPGEVSQRDIKSVLAGIVGLEAAYLRKGAAKK